MFFIFRTHLGAIHVQLLQFSAAPSYWQETNWSEVYTAIEIQVRQIWTLLCNLKSDIVVWDEL